ncbi:hypothetical protein Bsp3421_002616 [Burkholderia sp. FERM BP-3421]|uniref:hypothetical protein n=1 Tax=Burkholderia sp. FERM BP-3421 TaxID=1494466 RepID=UPI00235F6786|nr:hypothetical protein [Burkholderia sp. FERM BP-3421]WDD92598.1 hypothetical protein Bsp3421_002616 [Burkholderia sp. FERM BP-3421]
MKILARLFNILNFSSTIWATLLTGCGSAVTAIDLSRVQDVQTDIKRQVGVYLVQKTRQPSQKFASPKGGGFWCGDGSIDFNITSIKVTLLTKLDTTISGNASGKITPVLTIKPSLSTENVATSTLVFNEWLEPSGYYADIYKDTKLQNTSLDDAPIAKALLLLRADLIEAAQKNSANGDPLPCFSALNPLAPQADLGNTFQLDITYLTDANGQVQVGVGPFTVGGGVESKLTDENTITVSFVPSADVILPVGKHVVAASEKAAIHISVGPNPFLRSTAWAVDDDGTAALIKVSDTAAVAPVLAPAAAPAAPGMATSNGPYTLCGDPDHPGLVVYCDIHGNVVPPKIIRHRTMDIPLQLQ